MPAIVSDTTPLNYLVLIEAVQLLPRLYQRVLIPPDVRDELTRPKAPETVRLWMAHSPSWLEVVTPALPPDPALSHLDDGETQLLPWPWNTRPNCSCWMYAMRPLQLVS